MHFGKIGKSYIRVFSGQFREILVLKISSAFASKRFLDAILLFPKSFQLENSNFQTESISPSKTHF